MAARKKIDFRSRPVIRRNVLGISITQKRWRSKCRRFLVIGTEYSCGRKIFQMYRLDGRRTECLFKDPTKTFRTRNAAIKAAEKII